ncbi:anucleate primary sterigmata protein b [Diplodia corticola]|uniref:Anucleate primary sterigmata protein b n=1 Tax=Diplodia corticola TaxID=236234 RepID=A0A1J9R9A7_9PEZI|nr:anucleate primary sterigmata protein b [Diplodia corticola]OJD38134.1 anucleate primary sterigmata protein b [Diplodia corticola]
MARKSTDDEDVRSFDHSDPELPPLPSDDDDSFLRPPSDSADNSYLGSDGGSIMERDMQRKLLDIESSFLPDRDADNSESAHASTGADDTYMYGASSLRPPPRNGARGSGRSRDSSGRRSVHAEDVALPESPAHPDDAHGAPAPGQGHFDEGDRFEEGSSSFEEHAPSSPTAAAAERSQTRTEEQTSKQTEPIIEVTHAENQGQQHEEDARSQKSFRPTSSASTVKAERAENDWNTDDERRSRFRDTFSSTVTARNPSNASNVRKRPSFLRDRSRGASQRSTASSFAGRSESSFGDSRDSSDFALQTGGALPGTGMRSSERDLSRLPSLGSIASSISVNSDSRPSLDRARSTLSQADNNLERLDEEPRPTSASPPATPTARPFSSGTNNMTDTVITKHVQNIRVPDTVAREYREKHATKSPERPSTASQFAFSSRTKHNLTLKEQNSKIDKLSKENFDLKLKIHFLDQALQNRSDEGVKDMISKNVQLQTDLATEKKENQSLRRKVRELERKLKAQEEGMAAAKEKTTGSDDERGEGSQDQGEMEEEITYLRECLQQSETEIERLKEEGLAKEVEKRRMAEYVKSMGDRKNSEPSAGVEEAMEMWKDLLEAETARREQADDDAERLRDEIRRLKAEREQPSQQAPNVRHGHNMSRGSRMSFARSQSGSDGTTENRAGTSASSVTLVDQLKHENAELRRDLGAQTSMLVSRNRERERLQQEIEDLKLSVRRGAGGSVVGDSIFERSISRANHHRPSSRNSAVTRTNDLDDAERDEYEQKQAELRDQIAELKMTNQELEKQLNNTLDELERTEENMRQLDRENNNLLEDVRNIQNERDDILRSLEQKEAEFDSLREEAEDEIDGYEQELHQKEQDLERLINDLENRNEDFEALQQEMRNVSESLVMLEDDRNASQRRIQQLEQELEDANQELESLDQKLHEAQQKIERFEVQQESNQSEITFLREEQEGDKIRIGDLEAALNAAQMNIQEERERYKDLEDRGSEEIKQREALGSQEKEQWQKAFDDQNAQNTKAREEIRRLRKELAAKEAEATNWKQRLDDLENSLRDALGSLDGTKSSLLKDVTKLQRDLDETMMDLDHARSELADKERTLRNRDTLLESTSLESRKLADMLDKERQLRMQEKRQFEQSQRKDQSNTRTIQSYETRILELETSRSQDRRRINQLEAQYKDQLLERNNLLLALWNRLSTLCGTDWAQRNSLVNGELPTLEVIGRGLPGFSKNVLAAIKMVEGIIGGFKVRIRGIEKDLWKEYQTLEHKLDVRVKHLDGLEKTIRSGSMGMIRNETLNNEISRLKSENKHLKADLNLSRQNTRSSGDSADHHHQQRHPPPPPSSSSRLPQHRSVSGPQGISNVNRHSIASTLLRHNSSAADLLQHASSSHQQEPTSNPSSHRSPPSTPAVQPTEQRWIGRLKELERRLKAEREARLLDRKGARQRLQEGKAENEELRGMLEREKDRAESNGGGSGRSSPSHAAFPTIGTR